MTLNPEFLTGNTSAAPMLFKLISHSYKMFRRSELFEKSFFAIILLTILVLFFFSQLHLAGRMLPVLLQDQFPLRPPAEWVYGFLPIIMLVDFSVRFISQSIPAKHVRPYLHLPVKRFQLSAFWMVRSWLHPFNIYLLVFFYSFIRMTINPETSSQSLGLAGIFLLTAINQGILMWIKSMNSNKFTSIIFLVVAAGLLIVAYSRFTDPMIDFSLNMFLGFVYADAKVFSVMIAIALFVHFLTYKQLNKGFYTIYEQGSEPKALAANNRWEKLLLSVPVYGPYWLLEWRLVSRSKRSKFNFFAMIPMGVAFSLFVVLNGTDRPEAYIVIIFMIAASYGGFHLQHAFSWESHFFDFIASRNIKMYDFIKAKFNFYLLYAAIQLILVTPILMWHSMELAFLFAGMFFYATGFGFFFYLRTGVGNSARFDANGKSSFNMEGVTGIKFLQVLLLFFSILPFFFIGKILPVHHGGALLLGLTGLIFMLTRGWWISGIVRKFEKLKHSKLSLYRQK